MKMLKDLGCIKKQKDQNRYGEFECPICLKPYITRISSVKSGCSTKCKKCSCNKKIYNISEVLTYDATTGNFTRNIRTSNRVKKLDKCNNKNAQGYIAIVVNKKTYLAHRLAWIFTHGSIPIEMEIDHINGIRDDNRIDNLRLVSSSENSRNMAIGKKNKSGVIGVSFYKSRNKWRATIMSNNKQKHLGYFGNKDDAISARKDAEIKYNYHKNHGRNKIV